MRCIKVVLVVLAALGVIAAAAQAPAQVLGGYVSCVRCHALPMQQAEAMLVGWGQTQGHGVGYPPLETVCSDCHDTVTHEMNPNAAPPTPFLLWRTGGTGSLMTRVCVDCHNTTNPPVPQPTEHPRDIFPYNGGDPTISPIPPTSVLPLFDAEGHPNQNADAGGLVCTTCHDPHIPAYPVGGRAKFLRLGAAENWAPLCVYCHAEGAPTTGADLVIPSDPDSVRFQAAPDGSLQIAVTVKNRGNVTSPYTTGSAYVYWEGSGQRIGVGSFPVPAGIPPEGMATASFPVPPPLGPYKNGFFIFQLPPQPLSDANGEFVRAIDSPPPPENLRVTSVGVGEISLAWDVPFDPPAGLTWDVYRDGVKVTPWPVTYPTFADRGLAPETPHVYQVVAISQGVASDPSDPVGATTAAGLVIRVPEDRPTIQDAINAVYGMTSIHVAPGTYTEPINLAGKAGITIKGQDANGCVLDYTGPTVPMPTIDLGPATPGQPGNTLSGFTVRNGSVMMGAGDVVANCVLRTDVVPAMPLIHGGGLVAQSIIDTPAAQAVYVLPNEFLASVNSIYFGWQPFGGYATPLPLLLLNNDFPYWGDYNQYPGSGNFQVMPQFLPPGPPQEYLPATSSPTVGRGLSLTMYQGPPSPNVGTFEVWEPYTPQPPAGLVASYEASTRSIRLSWAPSLDAPSRVQYYLVYRSESPDFPPASESTPYLWLPAGMTSFEDPDLAPGVTYHYQVRAYNGNAPYSGVALISAPTNTASAAKLPNAPPIAVNDALSVVEDWGGIVDVVTNDSDPELEPLSIVEVSQPLNGMAMQVDARVIEYVPAPDFAGTDSFSYTVSDGFGGYATAIVAVSVTPVNDAPTITLGADVTIAEDAGQQILAGWASDIGDGDPEVVQSLMQITTSSNPALYSYGGVPFVSMAGTLSFTAAPNANGEATVTVSLTDDTGAGGAAITTRKSFKITVLPVNDPPVFAKGPDQQVDEDAGARTVAGWASGIFDGDPQVQGLTFTVATDNDALFSVLPAVAPDGTLTYTPAANANGVAMVAVALTDDATAGGPAVTTPPQTFTITVSPVNDRPAANDDTASTAAYLPVLVPVLANDSDVEREGIWIVSRTAGANGTTAVQGDGILYTPNAGFTGTDSFSYTITDASGGTATATVTVTVRTQKLRIASLTMATTTTTARGKASTSAAATALAVDENGVQVAGVAINGHWSGLTSDLDAAVTDAAGTATVASDPKGNANGTFTFTIDAAVKTGFELDVAQSVLSASIRYPPPPPPPPAGGAMHVASIVMAIKGKGTGATATVTVVDAHGAVVPTAVVSGEWTGCVSGGASGTTVGDGTVTISSPSTRERGSRTFTFAVTGIALDGWTYDALANVETSDSIAWP